MEKPTITVPNEPAPKDLVINDLVVGDGAEAVPGGYVKVHYLGVFYESGEEFDSSWDRGSVAEFWLSGLIEGWQEGIPGMKVGGRRELIVPPEKGYGPAGAPSPLAGRTLVFVIDLIDVR
ncbi:peptidylprolyl isomerase [Corynebacterium hadale]|uniref:Peptidyl-prolyl cis-trans isomerase n=3 Tax=Corynebacterium TaxID=1716 RepID=A0A269PDL6_9CORY|nr:MULTISPECIES: FKBP-type peptidyl-prolyl cis-trans isomerase [Corynebacterium]MBL7285409.1 FKBP-type peptidyl-prolyl cis-trans isomerase [Corynebacterium godavarianum]MCG7254945.1 FKBP-type peptidyl-prolyl cis-trans isomerase [Corynebacterium hadale]MCG7257162.1 FKBP-type peptidyl-prolyl cis-trans isomerase [Corynebacterium hadale]MCG7265815.1 FKBP-type peptidyl-prolyl cis-trans isomerase [Corynebacterium hadale]PAJ70073.1 peptidylprolyl isomerase [Corynebacterium hadale]